MLFNRTKIYSVLLKKDSANPLEEAIFVAEGFNIFAFLFNAFWALFNKLWLIFIALVIVQGLVHSTQSNPILSQYILIFINIWFGFEANNFKISSLERKGYILYDTVTGVDETDAQRRFYDKYTLFSEKRNIVKEQVQTFSDIEESIIPESKKTFSL
jgi:hypothetical protein